MCWLRWEVMSVTLSKLSLRNARRQARDYLVYFVTVVMAAALLYSFNGLVFSQEVQLLSKKMNTLPLMIVLSSIVVVCVFGWLVSYATGFMLSRRSRELGTYILIGLTNKQIARLFFLENLAVGSAALVLGLALGGLLYQILRAILFALFGLPYH
ncbi:MAG: FtsX-like permease family protein, partial [Acetatifactor sp.]|nr:FtsX-like permease family protein [Acetatifactor sp.]